MQWCLGPGSQLVLWVRQILHTAGQKDVGVKPRLRGCEQLLEHERVLRLKDVENFTVVWQDFKAPARAREVVVKPDAARSSRGRLHLLSRRQEASPEQLQLCITFLVLAGEEVADGRGHGENAHARIANGTSISARSCLEEEEGGEVHPKHLFTEGIQIGMESL